MNRLLGAWEADFDRRLDLGLSLGAGAGRFGGEGARPRFPPFDTDPLAFERVRRTTLAFLRRAISAYVHIPK